MEHTDRPTTRYAPPAIATREPVACLFITSDTSGPLFSDVEK